MSSPAENLLATSEDWSNTPAAADHALVTVVVIGGVVGIAYTAGAGIGIVGRTIMALDVLAIVAYIASGIVLEARRWRRVEEAAGELRPADRDELIALLVADLPPVYWTRRAARRLIAQYGVPRPPAAPPARIPLPDEESHGSRWVKRATLAIVGLLFLGLQILPAGSANATNSIIVVAAMCLLPAAGLVFALRAERAWWRHFAARAVGLPVEQRAQLAADLREREEHDHMRWQRWAARRIDPRDRDVIEAQEGDEALRVQADDAQRRRRSRLGAVWFGCFIGAFAVFVPDATEMSLVLLPAIGAGTGAFGMFHGRPASRRLLAAGESALIATTLFGVIAAIV